jgi:hypothetical protein
MKWFTLKFFKKPLKSIRQENNGKSWSASHTEKNAADYGEQSWKRIFFRDRKKRYFWFGLEAMMCYL